MNTVSFEMPLEPKQGSVYIRGTNEMEVNVLHIVPYGGHELHEKKGPLMPKECACSPWVVILTVIGDPLGTPFYRPLDEFLKLFKLKSTTS